MNKMNGMARLRNLCVALVAALLMATPVSTVWAQEERERETREIERDRDRDEERERDEEEDWDEEEEIEWFVVELELYQQLLDVVLIFTKIAEDSSTAAVAAVMAVQEHAEEPQDVARFFEQVLPQIKDPTVERAIRLKLVDVYAEMDRPQESLEQLRILITSSSGSESEEE